MASSSGTPHLLADSPAIAAELQIIEKRRRWLEVFLVLIFTVGNSLVTAIFLLENSLGISLRMTTGRSLYAIAHESASLLLLAYILSRRGLKLHNLGVQWSIRDVRVGVLVALVAGFAYFAGALFLQGLHYGLYGSIAKLLDARQFFANPSLAVIPFIILNPFYEELIVRAYLMTEVLELTGSKALAITISVLVQASYHLYYGWIGALSMAFLFLVFAIYYARSRRALPIIVAHGIFDLYAFIRIFRLA